MFWTWKSQNRFFKSKKLWIWSKFISIFKIKLQLLPIPISLIFEKFFLQIFPAWTQEGKWSGSWWIRIHSPDLIFIHDFVMQVVLAPFGMAATLTGVTCRGEEVKQLLEDWSSFWPLTSNAYLAKDAAGRLSPMPEGVEVCRQTRHFLNPLVTTDERLFCRQIFLKVAEQA